jgi:hypothetical protein
MKKPGMLNNFQLVYAFATYIIWGSLYKELEDRRLTKAKKMLKLLKIKSRNNIKITSEYQ